MKTRDAIEWLQTFGYFVDYDNNIVYVRETPNSMPDRIYEREGAIADKAVGALINKGRSHILT